MRVLVDTSIWSAALRRGRQAASAETEELSNLIRDHRVEIIGPVRQELLSGISQEEQFKVLSQRLEAFPDAPITPEDYVTAARYSNVCRRNGVQGSGTDFLICAVAIRNGLAIFTSDKDFNLFARHIPIVLHRR